jgi:excisionase family DNA binding protein
MGRRRVTLPPELIGQVVDELAAAVASRVAAELAAAGLSGERSVGEPWRLLPLEEAASRLGRSERWVRERVRRGELVSVRPDGGRLMFELEDLRAFAAARRVAPAENGAARGRRARAVERGWDA